MFTIVLARCMTDADKHMSRTKTNGADVTKTPIGMFEDDEIDNDLKMVDETIGSYYGFKANAKREENNNDELKPKGYDEAQPVSPEVEKLPPGGYVVSIMNAKVQTYRWGNVLVIAFDIIEGEQTGFYKRNDDAQTQGGQEVEGHIQDQSAER